MENHHFQWDNPLFLWPFSIAMLNYQRVYENGGNGFAGWMLNDFEQPAIDPWRQAMKPLAFSKKTRFFVFFPQQQPPVDIIFEVQIAKNPGLSKGFHTYV